MERNQLKTVIGVVAGLAVIALFFWFGIPSSNTSTTQNTSDTQAPQQQAAVGSVPSNQAPNLAAPLIGAQTALNALSKDQFTNNFGGAKGLQIADVVIGTGETVASGQAVSVHYIGRLTDGKAFDSSIDRGQPLPFTYGQGQLIKGFEQGMTGMRVGGVRRVIIPPELGYGTAGVTLSDGTVVIPKNATLMFDVQLVSVNASSSQ